MIDEIKLQQCGYCGRYFIGTKYLDEVDVTNDNIPLGYCPEAGAEYWSEYCNIEQYGYDEEYQ